MEPKFSVRFLEQATEFVVNLEPKARAKIIFNLNKASRMNDKDVFKKLNDTIWEFRTLYNKKSYRLFAFWDKTDNDDTLVFCTHGLIKKTQKIPLKEIKKAEKLREQYFNENKES